MIKKFLNTILNKNKRSEINQIEEKNLKEILKLENAILVDVRSRQEYNEGHINGAILLQSFEADKKAEEILNDKNAIIVLYCTSGIRSKKVAKKLLKKGYKNVSILQQ